MDLTKEVIEKIQELSEVKQIEIDGRKYSTGRINEIHDPVPALLMVTTLTGFVDYINDSDDFEKSKVMIHIANQNYVKLISNLFGPFEQRSVYITANTDIYVEKFNYGFYYDTETFIIALQSLFDETEDRDKILKLVGNIRDENVKTLEDDGVTQQVTAKIGIVHKSEVNVPNPVTLKPYRTFREIEQPTSKFVFRLTPGKEGSLPKCALFDAEGQSWILEAIQSIKEYLEGEISDIPIIA